MKVKQPDAQLLERIDALEGHVAKLLKVVGLEVDAPDEPSPLAETRLGAGLGRFREKRRAAMENRRS